MKTNMAQSSIDRYHQLMAEGGVSRQKALILSMLTPGKDYTRNEIQDLTKLTLHAVTGRVNALVSEGRLNEDEFERRRCNITGSSVKVVRLAGADGA